MTQSSAAAAAAAVVGACDSSMVQPLRSAYRSILVSLRGEEAVAAIEAQSAQAAALQGGSVHAWCMHAIQTLTQMAPAVRRAASSATGGGAGLVDGQHECALVLSFLVNMLQLLQMQPALIGDDATATAAPAAASSNAMDADDATGAAVPAASSMRGGRSLLPFLYANLFKYALHLHEFEQYYELLVHMPASFDQDESGVGSGSGSGDGLKLECLKRFLIELVRERRTHDLVARFNWTFPWQPRAQRHAEEGAGATGSGMINANGKTVAEEVEAMLYWNAQTSDIEATEGSAPSSAPFASAAAALASSPASAARVGGAGHYDLLHTFLLSRQRYLRAAQAMHDYFLRLECETRAPGKLSPPANFVQATVERLCKGRGRSMMHAGAASLKRVGGGAFDGSDPSASTALTTLTSLSHSEQSQIEQRQLTLDVVSSLLQRKLHALILIRDALRLAARAKQQGAEGEDGAHPDDRELFMLENDAGAAMTRLEEEQAEGQRWRESKENEEKEQEQQQLRGQSPLYKRSRNAAMESAMDALDSAPASGLASRFELLSLRSVEKRLELVLSQIDMLAVLQLQLAQRPAAALPPLDALLDAPQHVAGSFVSVPNEEDVRDIIDPLGPFGRHIDELLSFGLVDRAFHLARVFFDVEVGSSSSSASSLDANPNKQQYEMAVSYLFQEFASRICRMRAALMHDDAQGLHAAFPLRMDDSLMELRCAGTMSQSTVQRDSSESADARALRDAEQVLQLHLSHLDGGRTAFAFTLLVAEVYLAAGVDVPLWMRDGIAAFMDRATDAASDSDEQQQAGGRASLFEVRVASSIPTAHALSIASQPFLVFLRLLVSYGRFELLFALLTRYLDWLAEQSAAGRALPLERHVLADVFDAFLFVQDQAAALPSDQEDSATVQGEVDGWVDTLRTKVQKLLGAAAPSATAIAAVATQPQLSSRGFGSAPAAAPPAAATFGFGGSSSRFGFGGGAAAAEPTGASPPSRFGGGFGAPAAASPFSFTPSASPFADDRSAAATPAKHPFGGLPPVNAPSTGGFGFGGGFGGAAATTAASPFSLSTAPSTGTNPTASLIARASAL